MKVSINTFKGEVPKLSARLLPNENAQLSLNCDLESGDLKPTKQKTLVLDTGVTNQDTIFNWTYNDDTATGRVATNNTSGGWTGVTDGSLVLQVAGTSYIITGVDFTGDASMSDVASTIQAKIRTATSNSDTVTWSTDKFLFDFDDTPFISISPHYEAGTDITGPAYMNARGDIVDKKSEWLSFTNYTYIFNSPIIDDQFQRLYSVDSLVGEYRVRDNDYQFNPSTSDREMVLDNPLTPLTAVATAPPLYGGSPASASSGTFAYSAVGDDTFTETKVNDGETASTDGASEWDVNGTVPSEFKNGDSISIGYRVLKEQKFSSGSWATVSDVDFTLNTQIASFSGTTFSLNSTFPVYTHTHGGANWDVRITIDDNSLNTTATGTLNQIDAGDLYPAVEGQPRDGEILDRYYVWTFVYTNGEESPISAVSDVAKIYPEATAALTNIGTGSPPSGVVNKRIYTTDINSFRFLGEIAGTATTFTDNVANTGLGEALQLNNNSPTNLKGAILSSNGFVISWRDNDLFFSQPYMPYAFDDDFSLNVKSDIVACINVGNETYVLTEGAPYILSGYAPDSLTLSELPIKQSCTSERGVTRIGETIIYVSPDGLVTLNGASSRLITNDLFTRTQWQALVPSDIILGSHNEEVYIFAATQTYILSFRDKNSVLSQISDVSNAVFEDVSDDTLYIYTDATNTIYSLDTSATDEEYTWRSKLYDFKKRSHLSCAKVIADTYVDLTLNLYVNDDYSSPKSTNSVTGNTAFKLPSVGSYNTFAFELVGKDVVTSIEVGTSMVELDG